MFQCLEEYGYKCICHMVNEDRAALRQTITSMPRENEKEIQMHGGAGETGKGHQSDAVESKMQKLF